MMEPSSSSEDNYEIDNLDENCDVTGTTTASIRNSSKVTDYTDANRSPAGSVTLSLRRSSNHSISSNAARDAASEVRVNSPYTLNREALESTQSDVAFHGSIGNDNTMNHENNGDDIPHDDHICNIPHNAGANNIIHECIHIPGEVDNTFNNSLLSDYMIDDDISLSNSEYEDSMSETDDENEEAPNYLQALLELIGKNDSNQTIDALFNVNKIEILLAILKFSVAYSLPNSGVADLCKMINSFLNKKIIPESRYKIDKIFYTQKGKQYHAVCPSCKTYIGEFQQKDRSKFCNVCEEDINLKDPSFRDFFVTLDVSKQVQDCIESNEDYYHSVISHRRAGNSDFEDFYDGLMYKQFVASLPENKRNCYATSVFNSDGSPVFKSSKFSVWPIQLIINEVPIQTRLQKPIVYALWFGHDKPDMAYFMRAFVTDMNAFSENGIPCTLNNNLKNFYLYPLCCCVDSVARAPMQGVVQFNGHYGCNWCYHPGVSVFHIRGKAIKYPLLNDIPPTRTEEETFRYMLQSVESGRSIYGVKSSTPLINLKNFNVINGFVPDVMHCIDLGVAKQFAEYWLTSTNEEYTIPKQYINIIDEYITSFKVPTYLARLSRSIKDRNYWKAKEWHNWVLYYSVPILAQIPNFRKYVEHWSLLVQSYHLLLQDFITEDALLQADNLLKRFVAFTECYYGADSMSFNIHQLCHLTQSVANWGPLWSHFGYPFECGNGSIIKEIHAAKGVLSQICRNLSFKESVTVLQKHVNLKDYSPIAGYCYFLVNRYTQQSKKIGSNRYFGKCRKPNQVVFEKLNLSRDRTIAYIRLTKNKCLFQSSTKASYRSNNSFACLENGQFIQIEQFVIDEDNLQDYIVYRQIEVEEQNMFSDLSMIKRIIQVRPELSVIESKALSRISICMQINLQRYIASVPNLFCY